MEYQILLNLDFSLVSGTKNTSSSIHFLSKYFAFLESKTKQHKIIWKSHATFWNRTNSRINDQTFLTFSNKPLWCNKKTCNSKFAYKNTRLQRCIPNKGCSEKKEKKMARQYWRSTFQVSSGTWRHFEVSLEAL